MQQKNENKAELKMIKMSDVQSQTVDWLWYPFIPYGKLTIIQGDPGDGKTTLVLNIAARLSKGEGSGQRYEGNRTSKYYLSDSRRWTGRYGKTQIRTGRSGL